MINMSPTVVQWSVQLGIGLRCLPHTRPPHSSTDILLYCMVHTKCGFPTGNGAERGMCHTVGDTPGWMDSAGGKLHVVFLSVLGGVEIRILGTVGTVGTVGGYGG